jgi:branched-chain amino acid transport system substrate-binding protein
MKKDAMNNDKRITSFCFFTLSNLNPLLIKTKNKRKINGKNLPHLFCNNQAIITKVGGSMHYFSIMRYSYRQIPAFLICIFILLSITLLPGRSEGKQKTADSERKAETAEMQAMLADRQKVAESTPSSPLSKAPSRDELQNLQRFAQQNPPQGAPAVFGYGEKSDKEILEEKPREPRIAVLGPLTGELKFYGEEASNGAEIASDELDASGGIKGQEYELLVYDTLGRMEAARSGIQAFVKHKVIAVVGAATGEVSFSANKLLNDNQLIMVSAGSRRRLGDTGPYNFRITLDDGSAVKSLFSYIVEEKKWKNFAILSSVVNDYSIKLTAVFKNALYEKNLNLTHELYLWPAAMTYTTADDTSIAIQVAKLKKNMPDAIIYTGEGKEAGQLVKEMRKQRVYIPLIGSEDLMIPEFISLGDDVVGTLVYGGFDPKSKKPKIRRFVEAYKKKFGVPPTRLSALSYDAYNIISEAIKKAPSLRPSHVRMALLSIKDFDGVTGKTSITPTGECIKEPFIFEVMKQGDKYSFVGVKDPL